LAIFLATRLDAEPLANYYRAGTCNAWLREWQALTGLVPEGDLAAYQTLLVGTPLADPQRARLNEVISAWLHGLFSAHLVELGDVIQLFGAEHFQGAELATSTYRFTRSAYLQFATMDSLEQALAAVTAPLARLYADYLLYLNNLYIRPEFKDLLYEFDHE
jgi:hypothetical protein